eukprot:TRINITY_DN106274_c0_g1_i1.p1 TRINITY_DN106274_c0_g1~~TRINITY_DN106274_c0_g1_i1.p1  ORF type:complete len:294 (+),score=26.56 TRINITY_DN106274_c0_g1_i1:57-938(+)
MDPEKRPRWRFCTFNVFEGLDSWKEERVSRFGSWIVSQNLDVVGLNEANGFTDEKMHSLCTSCNLPFWHLHHTRTGFHLGIMSRHPIEVIDTTMLSDQLWHGLLHARVDILGSPSHVLVTHLTPHEASKRRAEACAIVDYSKQYVQEPLLLMGDLNSLSRADRDVHCHEQLRIGVISQTPKLAKKFCDSCGAIEYEPIDIFYRGGFVDNAIQNKHIDNPMMSTSVPTPANRDHAHVGGRLDYILANSCLASSSSGDDVVIVTVKDADTDFISDHYPVVLDMQPFFGDGSCLSK